MPIYRADNNKVIDTEKLQEIVSTTYQGQYGPVNQTYYRAEKSKNWYKVTESSWSGHGDISGAELLDPAEAARIVLIHKPENSVQYPELSQYLEEAVDW